MPTITGTAASEILTGSAGDDVINDDAGGADILRGLGGNDVLHVGRSRETPVGLLWLEGGDGDDLLDYYVFNTSQAILEGGAGNDVFRLWAVPGAVQISTGSGADVIDFGQLNPTWGGSLSVTDFTGGIGGDRISWGDHPTWAFVFLTGWGGGNPFADGYLSLTQVGADAVLWMDLDGDGGSQAAFTLVTFLNTQASTLTAWNLGYDPAGAAVPGQTINGSAAGDTLQGTNGNDVIPASTATTCCSAAEATTGLMAAPATISCTAIWAPMCLMEATATISCSIPARTRRAPDSATTS